MFVSYGDTSMSLYSTQYGLFGVPQGLQLLLHLLYHHGERSFSMGLQVPSSQFWYCGSKTFRILLCQNGGDAQDTAGLSEEKRKQANLIQTGQIIHTQLL